MKSKYKSYVAYGVAILALICSFIAVYEYNGSKTLENTSIIEIYDSYTSINNIS